MHNAAAFAKALSYSNRFMPRAESMTRAILQFSLVRKSRNRGRKVTLFAHKATLSGGKVTHFSRKVTLLTKIVQERVIPVNTPWVEA